MSNSGHDNIDKLLASLGVHEDPPTGDDTKELPIDRLESELGRLGLGNNIHHPDAQAAIKRTVAELEAMAQARQRALELASGETPPPETPEKPKTIESLLASTTPTNGKLALANGSTLDFNIPGLATPTIKVGRGPSGVISAFYEDGSEVTFLLSGDKIKMSYSGPDDPKEIDFATKGSAKTLTDRESVPLEPHFRDDGKLLLDKEQRRAWKKDAELRRRALRRKIYGSSAGDIVPKNHGAAGAFLGLGQPGSLTSDQAEAYAQAQALVAHARDIGEIEDINKRWQVPELTASATPEGFKHLVKKFIEFIDTGSHPKPLSLDLGADLRAKVERESTEDAQVIAWFDSVVNAAEVKDREPLLFDAAACTNWLDPEQFRRREFKTRPDEIIQRIQELVGIQLDRERFDKLYAQWYFQQLRKKPTMSAHLPQEVMPGPPSQAIAEPHVPKHEALRAQITQHEIASTERLIKALDFVEQLIKQPREDKNLEEFLDNYDLLFTSLADAPNKNEFLARTGINQTQLQELQTKIDREFLTEKAHYQKILEFLELTEDEAGELDDDEFDEYIDAYESLVEETGDYRTEKVENGTTQVREPDTLVPLLARILKISEDEIRDTLIKFDEATSEDEEEESTPRKDFAARNAFVQNRMGAPFDAMNEAGTLDQFRQDLATLLRFATHADPKKVQTIRESLGMLGGNRDEAFENWLSNLQTEAQRLADYLGEDVLDMSEPIQRAKSHAEHFEFVDLRLLDRLEDIVGAEELDEFEESLRHVLRFCTHKNPDRVRQFRESANLEDDAEFEQFKREIEAKQTEIVRYRIEHAEPLPQEHFDLLVALFEANTDKLLDEKNLDFAGFLRYLGAVAKRYEHNQSLSFVSDQLHNAPIHQARIENLKAYLADHPIENIGIDFENEDIENIISFLNVLLHNYAYDRIRRFIEENTPDGTLGADTPSIDTRPARKDHAAHYEFVNERMDTTIAEIADAGDLNEFEQDLSHLIKYANHNIPDAITDLRRAIGLDGSDHENEFENFKHNLEQKQTEFVRYKIENAQRATENESNLINAMIDANSEKQFEGRPIDFRGYQRHVARQKKRYTADQSLTMISDQFRNTPVSRQRIENLRRHLNDNPAIADNIPDIDFSDEEALFDILNKQFKEYGYAKIQEHTRKPDRTVDETPTIAPPAASPPTPPHAAPATPGAPPDGPPQGSEPPPRQNDREARTSKEKRIRYDLGKAILELAKLKEKGKDLTDEEIKHNFPAIEKIMHSGKNAVERALGEITNKPDFESANEITKLAKRLTDRYLRQQIKEAKNSPLGGDRLAFAQKIHEYLQDKEYSAGGKNRNFHNEMERCIERAVEALSEDKRGWLWLPDNPFISRAADQVFDDIASLDGYNADTYPTAQELSVLLYDFYTYEVNRGIEEAREKAERGEAPREDKSFRARMKRLEELSVEKIDLNNLKALTGFESDFDTLYRFARLGDSSSNAGPGYDRFKKELNLQDDAAVTALKTKLEDLANEYARRLYEHYKDRPLSDEEYELLDVVYRRSQVGGSKIRFADLRGKNVNRSAQFFDSGFILPSRVFMRKNADYADDIAAIAKGADKDPKDISIEHLRDLTRRYYYVEIKKALEQQDNEPPGHPRATFGETFGDQLAHLRARLDGEPETTDEEPEIELSKNSQRLEKKVIAALQESHVNDSGERFSFVIDTSQDFSDTLLKKITKNRLIELLEILAALPDTERRDIYIMDDHESTQDGAKAFSIQGNELTVDFSNWKKTKQELQAHIDNLARIETEDAVEPDLFPQISSWLDKNFSKEVLTDEFLADPDQVEGLRTRISSAIPGVENLAVADLLILLLRYRDQA
ncbi:hypothetical protein H6758_03240 [Candidatus Nomurabacteria bacterium]|nr:hypothetical protein [Candidatus Nomurabacteria bacterium]